MEHFSSTSPTLLRRFPNLQLNTLGSWSQFTERILWVFESQQVFWLVFCFFLNQKIILVFHLESPQISSAFKPWIELLVTADLWEEKSPEFLSSTNTCFCSGDQFLGVIPYCPPRSSLSYWAVAAFPQKNFGKLLKTFFIIIPWLCYTASWTRFQSSNH